LPTQAFYVYERANVFFQDYINCTLIVPLAVQKRSCNLF